jgi:formate-dependent nitrite reductase membrane component NrfD
VGIFGIYALVDGGVVHVPALRTSDLPALALFIGIFAIVLGLALIVFAFRTRDRQRNVEA